METLQETTTLPAEAAVLWSTFNWQEMDLVFNSEEDIQPVIITDDEEDGERKFGC